MKDFGTARHAEASRGEEWRGSAGQGLAWPGQAGLGPARQGFTTPHRKVGRSES